MTPCEKLESQLAHAVLSHKKEIVQSLLHQGATPTKSLFHHAFSERDYAICLALSEKLILTPNDTPLLKLLCNVTTDSSRTHICFNMVKNLILNNQDLMPYFQKNLTIFKYPEKEEFKSFCNGLTLKNSLEKDTDIKINQPKVKI